MLQLDPIHLVFTRANIHAPLWRPSFENSHGPSAGAEVRRDFFCCFAFFFKAVTSKDVFPSVL